MARKPKHSPSSKNTGRLVNHEVAWTLIDTPAVAQTHLTVGHLQDVAAHGDGDGDVGLPLLVPDGPQCVDHPVAVPNVGDVLPVNGGGKMTYTNGQNTQM